MTLTPGLRKFLLTAHVTFTVGWLGAVAGFLALASAGLNSQDVQIVRAAYLSMDLIARFVILPMSFTSLLIGLVQSLDTRWGLFKYYWVLAKLLITIAAIVILQGNLQPIRLLAGAAAKTTFFTAEVRGMQVEMVVASSGALLVLLVNTTLAVYKPWGLTPYGRRKQQEERRAQAT
jgi:hypothetical protein